MHSKALSSGNYLIYSVLGKITNVNIRLDAGKLKLHAQPSDPKILLADVIEHIGLLLSEKQAKVELHGGSVQARSEGVGFGSEFIVRLPLRKNGTKHKA